MGRVGLGLLRFISDSYRLLFGVRDTCFHVEAGFVVGGSRVLSGTVAKLGCIPPRGPCCWKMPPLLPVLEPGVFLDIAKLSTKDIHRKLAELWIVSVA
jgi:hypothetical protein